MTNTNVTSDSESNNIMAITFRICENKIVTLGKVRKQYYKYSLSEQKEILSTVLFHCELKGLYFTDLFYETTELKGSLAGKQIIHFHADFQYKDPASFYVLKEHALLLNKRYGPESYTAFDYKFLLSKIDHDNWKVYKRKDIKHPEHVWCAGI